MNLKTILIPTILSVTLCTSTIDFDQVPKIQGPISIYSNLEKDSLRFSGCVDFANSKKSKLETRVLELYQFSEEPKTKKEYDEREIINRNLSGYNSLCVENKRFQIKDFIKKCDTKLVSKDNVFCNKIKSYFVPISQRVMF